MLVYTQNVFAVAQTIVFLLFSLLFYFLVLSFPFLFVFLLAVISHST